MGCLLVIPTALLALFLAEVPAEQRDRICPQIGTESSWNPDAESFYRVDGVPCCVGLGQAATPTWEEWAPRIDCAGIDRTEPRCAIRFVVRYMEHLQRTPYCRTAAARWEMAQACYNAGLGWINRERKRCRMMSGCDEDRWTGHVNRLDICKRARAACQETRHYVRRIREWS